MNQLQNNFGSTPETAKGTYKTSIYIKSPETSCNEVSNNLSPVLSQHRINGIEDDNKVNIRVKGEENQIYVTTAAIHRHSDISNQRKDLLKNNLNFVSMVLF